MQRMFVTPDHIKKPSTSELPIMQERSKWLSYTAFVRSGTIAPQSAGTMRSPSRCALAPEGVGVGSAVGFGVMDTSAVTSGVASPGCGVSAGRGVAVTGA